jgi:alkylhydroperoxidase family enzyme
VAYNHHRYRTELNLEAAMAGPRISYVPLEAMDARMQAEMERCAREGTPRPESSAVRAHAPNAFWAFADSWRALFYEGVCDHAIKDLCRVYISRTLGCEYCGNQRSGRARAAGLAEAAYDGLLNFESCSSYDERQKAALAYAEAIAWGTDSDELWDRLHRHFSEPELVELGCFIALTLGQQSWIRLLRIDHHEYLAGSPAALAPGFEDAQAAAASRASPGYWAARVPGHHPGAPGPQQDTAPGSPRDAAPGPHPGAAPGPEQDASPQGIPETAGEPACYAHLVCPECGAVTSEGHRPGCPAPLAPRQLAPGDPAGTQASSCSARHPREPVALAARARQRPAPQVTAGGSGHGR